MQETDAAGRVLPVSITLSNMVLSLQIDAADADRNADGQTDIIGIQKIINLML